MMGGADATMDAILDERRKGAGKGDVERHDRKRYSKRFESIFGHKNVKPTPKKVYK